MRTIIEAIHDALVIESRGGVQLVPRINFGIREGFLRLMPAVIEELDVMGFKAFDAKFPRARYLIALFRPSTGELDCLIDAAYLTALRTGATTAVATRLMTGPADCHEIGVIGSGLEARTNLEALLAVREVRRVRVYSRDPARRDAFAAEVRERHDIDAIAVGTPQEAAEAPCVLAATNTGFNGPVAVEATWLGSRRTSTRSARRHPTCARPTPKRSPAPARSSSTPNTPARNAATSWPQSMPGPGRPNAWRRCPRSSGSVVAGSVPPACRCSSRSARRSRTWQRRRQSRRAPVTKAPAVRSTCSQRRCSSCQR